ncbi:universal stress protein [Psychroflexus sp. CAK8W]|uniref:Universal stress protein n=1 Tax=Psychroflexus longus TaxID=2873596 RepID=A0ABS7XEI9_9FLAO|nr:universal stress protein [Psychroflexus longus]MBZ9777356.1 universal stress protein [Psychroflexus longus]
MKRILVPTDFSLPADNALKVAAQIAKKYDGEIYILHLLELPLQLIDPLNEGIGGDLPESMFFLKLAHKKFAELLDKMSYHLEGIKIHEVVEFNSTSDGVLSTVKKYDCDIIVMGSNGSDCLQDIFIGSNTEKVVRSSKIPVLVIKKEMPIFKIENFAFVSNLTIKNRKAFKSAFEFSKILNAQLHLAYINTPNKFKTTEEIDSFLDEFISGINYDISQFHIYNDVTVERGIRNFSSKINADLIGIGTHGRKGISHFISGSIAEGVVNHVQTPILTFKI